MSRLAVRVPFNAAGPFVALKQGPIASADVDRGEVFPASRISHIGERKMRLMFDGRWIDMATAEQIETSGVSLDALAAAIAAEPQDADPIDPATLNPDDVIAIPAPAEPAAPPAPPAQDADGDTPPAVFGTNRLPALVLIGENEIQLGRIVASAVAASGLSNSAWNDLEEGYRDSLVLDRARAIGWTGEPLPVPAQESAGEAPAAPVATDAPETPPAPPEPPVAPVEPVAPDTTVVAVSNWGFGRWYTVNAAGEKLGKKLTKAQAEATTLPVVERKADHGGDA